MVVISTCFRFLVVLLLNFGVHWPALQLDQLFIDGDFEISQVLHVDVIAMIFNFLAVDLAGQLVDLEHLQNLPIHVHVAFGNGGFLANAGPAAVILDHAVQTLHVSFLVAGLDALGDEHCLKFLKELHEVLYDVLQDPIHECVHDVGLLVIIPDLIGLLQLYE